MNFLNQKYRYSTYTLTNIPTICAFYSNILTFSIYNRAPLEKISSSIPHKSRIGIFLAHRYYTLITHIESYNHHDQLQRVRSSFVTPSLVTQNGVRVDIGHSRISIRVVHGKKKGKMMAWLSVSWNQLVPFSEAVAISSTSLHSTKPSRYHIAKVGFSDRSVVSYYWIYSFRRWFHQLHQILLNRTLSLVYIH